MQREFRLLKVDAVDVPVYDGSAFVSYGIRKAFVFKKTAATNCGNCILKDTKECASFLCVSEKGVYFEALLHRDITEIRNKKGFREESEL